jgi:hypothetical protein
VVARLGGVGDFEAYPTMSAPLGPAEAFVFAALPLVALLPFAGAAGRLGVARA